MSRRDAAQPIDHVLVIPDGNRRWARREYLRDRLYESRAALRAALAGVEPERAGAIEARIEAYAERGADACDEGEAGDSLDMREVPAPISFLLRAYRRSAVLVDELIRALLARGGPRLLSIYALQPSNLTRSVDEIHGFLVPLTETQERWSKDEALCAAVRFRFIGDRALLDPERHRPPLGDLLRGYLASAAQLEGASGGDELQVNLLAPYDVDWEIEQACAGGRFDRSRLAVPEEVDLVIRSGGDGRSLGSGALPIQTSFSRYAMLSPYFPDCSVALLVETIEQAARAQVRRGT